MVKIGLDKIQEENFSLLKDQRVGLVIHPASVDSRLTHALDIFYGSPEVQLVKLFGPQHGISGQTQDNMIEWEGFVDPRTNLPVYSLYGEHRKLTESMLAGIDTLVFDLQDVGARYYTFIWTMLLSMEACAEQGKRFLVLDRPNPINCKDLEGNVLDVDYKSFVGLAPLPMRHGLTIGELAVYFEEIFGLDLDLQVVWLENYHCEMWFQDTGLPWVLPSPNMPTPETACVYPGFCLLEGTNLSEGRGTTRPFEIFGAPFIDPYKLLKKIEKYNLKDVKFRPLYFQPTFNKFAGEVCGGLQIHVTHKDRFRSISAVFAVLSAIYKLYPREFQWKNPPYEYEAEKLPIDILAGGADFRKAVEVGKSLEEMEANWQNEIEKFSENVNKFWCYED